MGLDVPWVRLDVLGVGCSRAFGDGSMMGRGAVAGKVGRASIVRWRGNCLGGWGVVWVWWGGGIDAD